MVVGGFADISDKGVTVLAERAFPRAEVTREILDGLIAEAQESAKAAEGSEDAVDAAAKYLADLTAAGDQLSV